LQLNVVASGDEGLEWLVLMSVVHSLVNGVGLPNAIDDAADEKCCGQFLLKSGKGRQLQSVVEKILGPLGWGLGSLLAPSGELGLQSNGSCCVRSAPRSDPSAEAGPGRWKLDAVVVIIACKKLLLVSAQGFVTQSGSCDARSDGIWSLTGMEKLRELAKERGYRGRASTVPLVDDGNHLHMCVEDLAVVLSESGGGFWPGERGVVFSAGGLVQDLTGSTAGGAGARGSGFLALGSRARALHREGHGYLRSRVRSRVRFGLFTTVGEANMWQ